MIEMNNISATSEKSKENSRGEEEINIIDIFLVISKNIRLLTLPPLAIGVIALGISYAIPPKFIAGTTFLPPQQQQSAAVSMLQSLGALGGLAGAASGLKNPNDQYISFLKSTVIADSLIDQFNLIDRYDSELKEDSRKTLADLSTIKSGKDNIISIEFEDEDPVFAAKIANAYVKSLEGLLSRLAITEAQQRRAFFEKQLKATKEALVTAEQQLAASGISASTLNINPETALEGPARLRAQVTAQEVRIASLRGYLTENAPEFRQAMTELSALRSQLSKAEREQQPSNGIASNAYIAKYREFKYQETLFELFAKQYEIARIDESREGATIQIIDEAKPPERKSKPRKAIIAAIATIASVFILLIYIFAIESIRSARKSKEKAEAIEDIKKNILRSLFIK